MLHQIGSGVLGPVFRTYDPQHDRLVAVKAFRLDIPPQTVARLADAFRRLVDRPLTHPAAVRVIDAGLEGTAAFVAMEYAVGESLDIALRSAAPWPIERALPWLTAVANAIDAAWADGTGHGALHPRDILLSSDPADVRVTGFGIASALESIGEKPPVRRPYTAPERLRGQPWDVRADVYSLGVIAHEVLAGRRPAGPGEQDGVFAPGMQPEARVSLRRVLAAALAERPEDRFAKATAFIEALGAVARGDAPAMPKPGAEASPVLPAAVVEPVVIEAVPITVPIEVEKAGMASFASESEGEPAVVPPPADEPPQVLVRASEPARLPDPPPTVPPPPAVVEPETQVRSRLLGAVTVPAPTPPTSEIEPVAPIEPPAAPPSRAAAATIAVRPEPAAARSERAPRPVDPVASSPLRPTTRADSPANESTSFRAWQAPPPPAKYPWAALAAMLLAGIALGLVGGYQLGSRRVPQSAVQSAAPAASSSARADTDVPIAPPGATEPTRPASPSPDPGTAPVQPPATVPDRTPASDVQRTSAPRGRLLVRSVPAGALVFVDGRRLGETPATLRDLPLGSHTVEVARPGYVPQTEQVSLTASVPARTVTMELKPGAPIDAPAPTGSVYLDTRPRGARAIIDGRFVGTTPISVPELTIGEHVVTFELPGIDPVTSKFTVKPGVLARVTLTLK